MFLIALGNVVLTLAYALPGFILCKAKKATADHLSTLSAVLVYICSPFMIINSFLKIDFSLEDLGSMGLFFIVTLVTQSVFMLILWLIFKKRRGEAKFRVATIGSVMGNVGFFGLPIVKALCPNSPVAMCYSAMYVMSMNMLVFTVGVFCLTGDNKFMSVKRAFLNPTTIACAVAVPLYVLGAGKFMAEANLGIVLDAINLLGSIPTPFCMIILGIRLATVDPKKLFLRPFVYFTCAMKLIVYPLFCYLLVVFLPLGQAFKASVLILSAVPCASIILNMSEIYGGENELAANSVLLSTLMCFLTIPVLALLL